MKDTKFLARLKVLRRKARRRLFVYGVVMSATVAVAGFLLVIASDWLLSLPALLRILAAICFASVCLGAVGYWIVKPWRTQVSLYHVASRLERTLRGSEGPSDDRAGSAGARGRRLPRSGRAHDRNTEQAVGGVRLESVLSLRPLLVRTGVLIVSVAVLAGAAWAWPGWIRTGVDRYARPFGDSEWPTDRVHRPANR